MIARFARDPLMMLAVGLLAASVFFAVEVSKIKAAVTRTDATAFADGDTVTISAIVDGDEVSVQAAGGQASVVRIVGIKSFHRASYDRLFGRYGRDSYDYLQNHWLNRRVTLRIGKPRVDQRQRLLAYLEVRNENETTTDVGRELVERGYSLVYREFPFAREQQYLAAEARAANRKAGLWANEAMVERVRGLHALWSEKREQRVGQ